VPTTSQYPPHPSAFQVVGHKGDPSPSGRIMWGYIPADMAVNYAPPLLKLAATNTLLTGIG